MIRLSAALLALALCAAASEKPHVVFITGDDEYRSEITMPMIAHILESRHGMRCTVLFARPEAQTKDNIEGLEALRTADLAVFFLRFRQLPDEQLQHILEYVKSGKPLVGLRTSTHAFRYPPGHKHAALNDSFGREVFGQKWIRHHGARSSTDVSAVPEQLSHPILRGVEQAFHVRSWLYQVKPLEGDSAPLLMGRSVDPQGEDGGPNPVAWTKTHNGARVFFTTLGHPEDFAVESVRRLLVNGIYWALGKDAPARADVKPREEYTPPPTNRL